MIDTVAREVARIVREPEIVANLEKIGVDPLGNTPAQFAAFLRAEAPVWRDAVKAAGVRPEQ